MWILKIYSHQKPVKVKHSVIPNYYSSTLLKGWTQLSSIKYLILCSISNWTNSAKTTKFVFVCLCMWPFLSALTKSKKMGPNKPLSWHFVPPLVWLYPIILVWTTAASLPFFQGLQLFTSSTFLHYLLTATVNSSSSYLAHTGDGLEASSWIRVNKNTVYILFLLQMRKVMTPSRTPGPGADETHDHC